MKEKEHILDSEHLRDKACALCVDHLYTSLERENFQKILSYCEQRPCASHKSKHLVRDDTQRDV